MFSSWQHHGICIVLIHVLSVFCCSWNNSHGFFSHPVELTDRTSTETQTKVSDSYASQSDAAGAIDAVQRLFSHGVQQGQASSVPGFCCSACILYVSTLVRLNPEVSGLLCIYHLCWDVRVLQYESCMICVWSSCMSRHALLLAEECIFALVNCFFFIISNIISLIRNDKVFLSPDSWF